jgi:hypothetical protein
MQFYFLNGVKICLDATLITFAIFYRSFEKMTLVASNVARQLQRAYLIYHSLLNNKRIVNTKPNNNGGKNNHWLCFQYSYNSMAAHSLPIKIPYQMKNRIIHTLGGSIGPRGFVIRLSF